MTQKVKLLSEESLAALDEMLPSGHVTVTGDLGVQLVAIARWAAKAHDLLTTYHFAVGCIGDQSPGQCCDVDALLSGIEEPS